MPSRYYKRNFIKGYFYHIYNRGANKETVFWDNEDYQTFMDILAYYLTFPLGKPLSILNRIEKNISASENKVPNLARIPNATSSVKLCAYCLMPNHFHLLIMQDGEPSKENGITNLMRRIIITYAMYVKKKYDHSGTLFQGKFKNVLVQTDSQLQQLSKYIHRNPMENQGSEPLYEYKYSSYKYFIGRESCPEWIETDYVLRFFSKENIFLSYKKFVEDEPASKGVVQGITLD